jgi:hypothetical protein
MTGVHGTAKTKAGQEFVGLAIPRLGHIYYLVELLRANREVPGEAETPPRELRRIRTPLPLPLRLRRLRKSSLEPRRRLWIKRKPIVRITVAIQRRRTVS